ncbi:recombinase family protein [Nocardia sp. NPDC058666]|uniref:recombinase family protein n=1 Tax=unclassified Nocardia TaxID=2637762 RepID=UPI00366817FD
MAELVYTRVSTDEQSTDRQTYLLREAGLSDGADGVRLFADPATSSKVSALERDGFRRLAGFARLGDRLTVSELYGSRGADPPNPALSTETSSGVDLQVISCRRDQ